MSWSRRIGIAGALVLVVGGSIAFAGQALDVPGRFFGPNAPGAPPPPAPTLLSPAAALVRADEVELTVIQPVGLRNDQEYRVRIYVNDELARERAVPHSERFTVDDIPLEQGQNLIRAALVGAGGEGEQSTAVAIMRDDLAPEISIASPAEGQPVYDDEIILNGRTEAGADITITSGGQHVDTNLDQNGRFSAALRLRLGDNVYTLRSVDPAGNIGRHRLVITRGDSAALINLTITPAEIEAATLPARLRIEATIRDEQGRPINNAPVTFGLSPPSLPTTTYRTTTTNGVAVWPGVDIPDSREALGTWVVTVLAELPSGNELRDDASLSVR